MSKQSVDSHIAAKDYFGTLATLLDLLRQDLEVSPPGLNQITLLKGLTTDLIYLQENYEIEKKR